MRTMSQRRPEVLLLASILVFAIAVVFNLVQRPASGPVAFDAAAPAPAPVARSDEQTINQLRERVRRNPEDVTAYAQLGTALLLRVRSTGDPMLYVQAEEAFNQALARDPQQLDALLGQGSLALSRHQFAQALEWGEKARAVNPFRAQTYGILGDAYVELGRYDEAAQTMQKMVDTRPDLSSYSRVSYVRELNGDQEGAIKAMQAAVDAGPPGGETTLWTQVQLGHLYFNQGDLEQAQQIYAEALYFKPDYAYALAGMAQIDATQGNYKAAIDTYVPLVQRLPLPQFAIALGELYQVTGQQEQAQTQYDLVRAIEQLNANAGMVTDLELVLFDAEHSTVDAAAVTRARETYAQRPTIYAADALAWTLYQYGDYAEAQRYSDEALRLGTRDATLHYHAGKIAAALGDDVRAREELTTALDINPYFSVLHASEAQALVGE